MLDMLATLKAVEAEGRNAMETLKLHLWLTNVEYAQDTDRPELRDMLIEVIETDFNFKVVMK